MTITVSPLAYGLSTLIGALVAVALCVGGRRYPGRWTGVAAKALAVILVGEQISWQIQFVIHHDWSRFDSLPFDLCDFTCFVAAAACWTQLPLLVEVTWFWALAGTLQAIITPDEYTPFPYLSFDNYVVEHLAIVVAALYLVIGLRDYPARGAAKRVFALTIGYAGVCAILDAATGGDYLYLRRPPPSTSLLNLLGHWPWYVVWSAAIALVLAVVLNLPFSLRVGEVRPRQAIELGVGWKQSSSGLRVSALGDRSGVPMRTRTPTTPTIIYLDDPTGIAGRVGVDHGDRPGSWHLPDVTRQRVTDELIAILRRSARLLNDHRKIPRADAPVRAAAL